MCICINYPKSMSGSSQELVAKCFEFVRFRESSSSIRIYPGAIVMSVL